MKFKIPSGQKLLILVYSLLVLAQLIFSGATIVTRFALRSINPFVFGLIRVCGACTLFLVLAAIVNRKWPHPKEIGWFVLLGILGIFVNQLFFILAVAFSGSILPSIMQPLNPVFTTALSLLFRQEPFALLKLCGIAMAVVGTFTMVDFTLMSFGNEQLIGFFLLLSQQVAGALFFVFQKRLLNRGLPHITLNAGMHVTGAVCMSVTFVIAQSLNSNVSFWDFSPEYIWTFFYVILLQSVSGYLILSFSNKYTDSSIVAASNTIQPIVVAILTWIIFQELITLRQLSGAGLIIAGLVVVTYQKYQESKDLSKQLLLKIQDENEEHQMNGIQENGLTRESEEETDTTSE